ncbi:MFS transporter [Marinobacter sp. BGYM27]|uniref:MFS transporter n=1 Tax=Marinobacter sp. BGYM27 TaxID=2975597 RepID=UPI0021A2C763|nr:MFS transporter [Marinobacter sp. BGYM27]MDG5498459.1 MFS transporter [Marinobacter sp. BGYM27]
MSAARLTPSAWTILIAGCLILMLAFGFRASFGLFVQPISAANDWGRDVIGLALAIQNLAWGIIAVLAGGLADRFGNTRVIVVGAVLYAVGLWLTAGVDSVWSLQMGAGLLVGAGIAGTGFGIVLPLMAKAVSEDDRQWVLGVGTAAGSMGQFLIVPLAQQFIDLFGWSGALNAMGLMALAIVILAMPLARMAKPAATGVLSSAMEDSLATTIGLARGHLSYWLLTVGFFVCGFHLAFITVHFPGYLTDNGFDPDVAAWAIALIGLCNVIGAMASGYISGRVSMKRVLMFIYLSRAVVTVGLLLLPLSLTTVLLFSCLTGFLWLATVPPTTGLVATMFGTRYMATLYGVVFLGHQVGSFTGVWLGGWIYEHTGNYDLVWWTGVVLSIVAVLLHWPIRESRVRELQAATS